MKCKTCRQLAKDFIQPRSERIRRLMKLFRKGEDLLEDWDADLIEQEMTALDAIINHKIEHGRGMRPQHAVEKADN